MKIAKILQGLLARFSLDQRGNVAMITGLLAVPLVGAVGAGIDYTRLVSYRLKLDTAATSASLAAIDTARALLLANPTIAPSDLEAAAKARAEQMFSALAPPDTFGTTAFLRIGDTLSAKVDFTGDLATTFMGVLGMQTMKATGASNSTGQIGAMPGASDPSILVEENFNVAGLMTKSWDVFKDFNNWKTNGNGNGIEIGQAGTYGATRPPNNSTYVAEIDGLTYIARKIYLTPGWYELRYYYRDRITDANFAPSFVCGASADDIAWAKSVTRAPWNVKLNLQAHLTSVYLELANTDSPPARFTATEHTEVDACSLSSGAWIERSVKMRIYAAGFYWLAFQSERESSGYGALLSGIRFCVNSCPGTPLVRFPWKANSILFSDNFENPTGDTSLSWTERTLDASGTNSGWTRLPTGWTTSPVNQVDFQPWGIGGSYMVELDASADGSGVTSNRTISRRFLLMPGYYQLSFTYTSWGFSTSYNLCDMSEAANMSLLGSSNPGGRHPSTMNVRPFIDADLLVSHPYSDPVLRAPASWFNPDDTPATLPRLPSNRLASCVSSIGPLNKTINFEIRKPGFYWLSFQGSGTADNNGGAIDDVSVRALGPPSMSAPEGSVRIPIAGISPGSTIKKRHLEFIAN